MLEIANLTKTYGNIKAVNNLSLHVEKGEFFGCLGPNGAGKTTTIKSILGLVHPDSGHIKIAGIDVQKEPEKAKKHVGYVPDTPYLYEKLSAREFLHFVGGLYEMDEEIIRRRIDWLIETFQMGAWVDKRAEEYSHGMRQKTAMSASFIHEPELIILDEPMVALDPQSARLVKDMLRLFAGRGTTVFLSSHVLSVVEELCERVAIIAQGRLVALGTISELKELADVEGGTLEELFLKLVGGQFEARLMENE